MTSVTRSPAGRALTKDKARELTDSIRRDAQSLWMHLLRAFEGGAHIALGYSSWHAYCQAEFQFGQSHAYRLIDAARLIEMVEPDSPMGERTIQSERVAREFAPLADDPETLRAVHAEVVETAPRDAAGKPVVTARAVRAVVEQRRPPSPPPAPATPPAPPSPPRPAAVPVQRAAGLNDLVRHLRHAVEHAPENAPAIAKELEQAAARGLYGPATEDPARAFQDLVGLVRFLMGLRS